MTKKEVNQLLISAYSIWQLNELFAIGTVSKLPDNDDYIFQLTFGLSAVPGGAVSDATSFHN